MIAQARNTTRPLTSLVTAAVLLALATAGGCVANRNSENAPDTTDTTAQGDRAEAKPASLDTFTDGRWSLRVTRTWDATSATVTAPSDPLREADYRPAAEPLVHPVVVSKSGTTVTIGTTPFTGTRTAASSTSIDFDLSTGTFAGGRFIVRPGTDTLEAELTLFGSGRPIVESHRGELIRND